MTASFFLKKPIFSQRPLDDTNGINGYWPLDTDYYDYSGRSGLTGTVTGTPVLVAGLVSPGALFTNNGSLSLPGNIFSSAVLSLSLWIIPTNTGVYNSPFSIYTGDGDSTEIFVNPGGTLTAGSFTSGITSATSLTTGFLYHIAFTNDGSTTKLYINGVRDGPTGTSKFTTFSATGSIGSRSGSFIFQGTIDDVRTYQRVLSDGEINALYQVGLARPDEGEWPALFTTQVAPTFQGGTLPFMGVG